MNKMKMGLCVIGLAFVSLPVLASEQPYKGQHHRDIKALSTKETHDLLSGKGMGFAKAAELNHYPGPRHLLDAKTELNLSAKQIEKLEILFTDMQNKAKRLGDELVAKEREIDLLFKSAKADSEALSNLVSQAGEIRSKLRFVHLNTHIKTRPLLSQKQIAHYDQLRGYGQNGHSHHH